MRNLRQIINGLLIAVCLLGQTSCNDSFLERAPLDQLSNENYWETSEQVRDAANACYWALKGKDFPINICEGLADNAPWYSNSPYKQIGSGLYGSDLAMLNNLWVEWFRMLRRCNFFLANYEKADAVNPVLLHQYAGEVLFLRAFIYHYMSTLWGDVPIVTAPLLSGDEGLVGPRDPHDKVVDFVIADLKQAIEWLPAHYEPASENFGRISGAAAAALLSRVALQNRRWEEARDAALMLMPGGKLAYHELYSTGKPDEDYFDLFTFVGRTSRNANNKEAILSYVYNFDMPSPTKHNLSRELQVPDQFARFTPTKSLIDSYLCVDGLPIDKSPLYKGNGHYKPAYSAYDSVFVHRDPRLKQSIVYPGYDKWYGRLDGRGNKDPLQDASKTHVFRSPKFKQDGKGSVTTTGYYVRKYCEPSKVGTYNQDDNDIIFLRYGEVLLNYAEAMFELGQLDQPTIDRSINLLRDRVGMKHMVLAEISANGLSLKDELHRERRVELFFEGQRYFDLLRWKEGYRLGVDKSESVERQQMGVFMGIRKDYAYNQNDFSKSSSFTEEGFLIWDFSRVFVNPKNYLWSLPFKQMDLNPNLKPNNPGWEEE